ncbi:lytic polysaccharide monooxygenase [Aaosphaeria arxii CBS 175.79]|uniref:lytic cellulose monooxygenase (C4-dehydrogenating) n=1 Tax=Aaosphaeria arxii CBS 175.79 TaxID=1450172 RepID=A0A6A5XTZ2_9PLEO|nr:lytic polysaccharide monooxygenase [Aaosphaeria arxii CBS 175.79]KAF2016825.1 lytic polysaccharide monooxygenase [Aaosphaeria arxii CBS 175.79]
MKGTLWCLWVWYLHATTAFSHYVFAHVSHNGGPLSKAWQFIRKIEPGWAQCERCGSGEYNPYFDIYDNNFRCGRGAATSGRGVETLTVNAGDHLAFFSTLTSTDIEIFHEGPGLAYLSKPDSGELEDYSGDGDWFKIQAHVANKAGKWALQGQKSMNFTIPKSTPPGKYLMRVEHIYPYDATFNSTQFYLSCAHIDIKGPGGGTPKPTVKFPGAYDLWEPALWVPYRFTSFPVAAKDVSGYVPPGPPVWNG